LKKYSKKIKILDGVIYNYDDNYYYFTKTSFNKIKKKSYLINELKRIVELLKPSYIIDLSIIYSNYLKPSSILQLSSAIIHNDFSNYKNIQSMEDYIQIKTISKNTKYLTTDTITINNLSNDNVKITIDEMFGNGHKGSGRGAGSGRNHIYEDNQTNTLSTQNTNKILLGSESIYLAMFLSNHFNIPAMCLGIVSDTDPRTGKIPSKDIDKLTTTFFTLF
jgi:hypothetical protein